MHNKNDDLDDDDFELDLDGLDFSFDPTPPASKPTPSPAPYTPSAPSTAPTQPTQPAQKATLADFTSPANRSRFLRPDPALDYSVLDEMGVAGYDVFFIGGHTSDNMLIVEAFLENTAEPFKSTGVGIYDCVWRVRPNRGILDEEVLRRQSSAWRTATRRIRDRLAPHDPSIFTVVRTMLLPDNLHAAVSLGRMRPDIYAAFDGQRRGQNVSKIIRTEHLKNFF